VLLAREPILDERGVTPALVSVANRPLLRHALDWLEEGGVRDVAIVATDRVAEHAWEASAAQANRSFATNWLFQVPGEPLGESLTALTGFLGHEPFILHMADCLAEDTMSGVLGDEPVDELGAVILTQGRERALAPVVDIHSGRRTDSGAAAGVAVLGGGVLGTTMDLDAPPGRELNALAAHLHRIGGSVEFRAADAWWRFADDSDAMLEGNRFALERLRRTRVDADVTDSVIQGPVSIDPSARIESSTVRGPAVIGPGARIHSAYVGPFTSIGAHVLIEGAEIENSVVLDGASVTHVNTRLEGSVVGVGASVFRDFRLPRAMRVDIGPGARVAIT
jgi:glucose-1-phosphate thymidylyltransferase